ncbi:MAG: hypothetical protein FWD16_08090 [Clostridia bacterium]|nr:hypothetical protein [Clostridia bacterium]
MFKAKQFFKALPIFVALALNSASAQTCQVSRDAQGFFTRTTSLGSYSGYVPPSFRDGTRIEQKHPPSSFHYKN